ncbi:MAG TPA: Asp-tRNA(Asn)/Glu-tRNA(Gln) amidotransferase subunit GatB [Candidatus Sulfotelmatobacter sp.]|nr:Asp-tRNA(Asn)/Glu-tRNA(Gln) amidotransferase subunit GatB [Candidatus Sulfotelmatobacter sp.]
MNYKPVIGLEVHVELKTNSKMFCSCSADYFGQEPNTHTCPVCLGLPGALPFPNKKAIEWCVMIGLSLNCEIPLFSKFDRKNYFYPDLSKGYQISQYDMPFCQSGFIELSNGKKIGITRVHMEEDTGKLIHIGNSSLIDFNRSGVPLVEIVTEPDFETSQEVKEYLQKLQQIVRYLGVSNADMEKGNMRLEPNISLRKEGEKDLPKYKVEVKNINSFGFVGKAIDFEIERQKEILERGKTPVQETRGFVEKNSSTVSQRVKEEASDYRYFPEPDIPPIRWTKDEIEKLKTSLPELPDARAKRLVKELSIRISDAVTVTDTIEAANVFEDAIKVGLKQGIDPQKLTNFIVNRKTDFSNELPAEIVKNFISAKKTIAINENDLEEIINRVLKENPNAVLDYKKGKETVIMFLVGQVMRQFKEKVDAEKIKAVLTAKLK